MSGDRLGTTGRQSLALWLGLPIPCLVIGHILRLELYRIVSLIQCHIAGSHRILDTGGPSIQSSKLSSLNHGDNADDCHDDAGDDVSGVID